MLLHLIVRNNALYPLRETSVMWKWWQWKWRQSRLF